MTHRHDAIIVGAGFGGIGAAIQFQRMGLHDVVILDRDGDLGGTWNVNRYPGLAVDIASVTYSYSFEPNPRWSRVFAPGAEIKAYAEYVADKHGLRDRMRFGTTVIGARWDDESRCWEVETADGRTLTARYLAAATGFLSQPKMPDIPGIDSFAGTVIHTSAWQDDHDLRGCRAAVIGTGATAVQLIPRVAEQAADLTVYQRTPIWVTAKPDWRIPQGLQRLFARFPAIQRAARLANSALLEALVVGGVLHYGRLKPFNKGAERLALTHLRRQVKDPATRRALTPRYSFGCKRPTFSNDYYPTFNRPNVHLETDRIAQIEPDGIVTATGRRTRIDTLLLATGFDLWETNFPAFEIIGRDGRDLGKWWRENRFQAYQGITVPGFPNFVCLNSPYSYSGLSYFWTIECQMAHMGRLFGELERRGATVFEVTEEANAAFLDWATARLTRSVFHQGSCSSANSYYFNQHGEAALLRPSSLRHAQKAARTFPLDDYTYRP